MHALILGQMLPPRLVRAVLRNARLARLLPAPQRAAALAELRQALQPFRCGGQADAEAAAVVQEAREGVLRMAAPRSRLAVLDERLGAACEPRPVSERIVYGAKGERLVSVEGGLGSLPSERGAHLGTASISHDDWQRHQKLVDRMHFRGPTWDGKR